MTQLINTANYLYKSAIGNAYSFIMSTIALFFLVVTVVGLFGFLPEEIQQFVSGDTEPLLASGQARALAITAVDSNYSQKASAAAAVIPETSPMQSTQQAPAIQSPSVVAQQQNQISPAQTASQASFASTGLGDLPNHIYIPKIGADSPILNPSTTSTTVLDAELLKGAVRYPGSGRLDELANMFIFGHSSTLSVTHNPAYKVFNNLKLLEKGDEIRVDGTDRTYVYRVRTVSVVKNSLAYVDLSKKEQLLTISTCNVFGKKEERVVVEAEFAYSFSRLSK